MFYLIGIGQNRSEDLLFKKYSLTANTANSAYFYLVKIRDSAATLKKILRLKAKRQFSETFFIVDKTLLNDLSAQKEFIEKIELANNFWKLSSSAESVKGNAENSTHLFLFYIQFADTTAIKKILASNKSLKILILDDQRIASLICSYKEVEKLFLNDDEVIFIDVVRSKPITELGTPGYDLSANKINLVHNQYPAINGAGQHVSIKEDYYDTTDIDLKGRIEISPLASSKITNHANFMATIIAGAGNSIYYAKGVAWQASISSSSFEQVLPDADDSYMSKNITVQNHSYGTGIDNSYGLNALAFDKSANTNPNLLHIFSSGNSGTLSDTTAGIYKGIEGYANLTGNFKMAKNILTVGAVDSLGNLVPQSSSGPAYDGRIKPDIVAFQQNGTSEAAALVAGTTLLLQQYYKSLYGNNLPSALAKAIVINTADDIGTPGPDYKTGYGNLNAIKAMNLLNEKKILAGNISQSDKQFFTIHIPENIRLLKVTLTWNDTATTAATPKALINDLNLEVGLNGQIFKPWVLNSFPNIDSLRSTALRKRDSLNNVEQVTIENPVAGNYSININSYNLLTQQQQYFVAYSWDSLNLFKWEKPSKIDFVEAGTKSILRWQNTFASTGDVEYSLTDNNWLPLATGVDLTKNYFYWNVPDTISRVVVRMKIANSYFYSDTFLITSLLKPTTGFVCGDSLLIYWNKLKNVSQYQLYQLGEKYMEPFLITADTTAVISKNNLSNSFIAVAPVLSNGKTAEKSYAFDFSKQGAGCFINSFYANKDGAVAKLNLTMGTLINVATIIFEKQEGAGYTSIATPAVTAQLDYQVNYNPLKKGITNFRVKIILKSGQVIYSNPEAVFYAAPGEYVLFPVPVLRNSPITVISSLPDGEIVSLIDATGRTVLHKELISAQDHIPTSSLQPGIYFYQVTKKGIRLASGKLIIL